MKQPCHIYMVIENRICYTDKIEVVIIMKNMGRVDTD